MPSLALVCPLLCALGFSVQTLPAAASPGKEASGTVTVDGKKVEIEHAYLDVTDPEEPIIVLSDKALPPGAIPFIPEKLVKEQQLHAVAFSISRKDGKLTNTFGKLYCPGHEFGVGLGRVEEGVLSLAVRSLDASTVEGSVATVKPVKLSYITYSFELKFRATAGKPKS
jgi:hypothetical protein